MKQGYITGFILFGIVALIVLFIYFLVQPRSSKTFEPENDCFHQPGSARCINYCDRLKQINMNAACAGVCGRMSTDPEFSQLCMERPRAMFLNGEAIKRFRGVKNVVQELERPQYGL